MRIHWGRNRQGVTGNSIWRYPNLGVRDWPDPQPGPMEVLLEVQACGVCGSDMHFYETDDQDYILYPGLTRFPTILGHEFSAKVVEIGKQVTQLKPGDMVTVEEMIWCGRCIPCRNGYPNHCTNLEEIGFTIPGAFANYIAVDEKFCWKIDAIAEHFGDETRPTGGFTGPSWYPQRMFCVRWLPARTMWPSLRRLHRPAISLASGRQRVG
jgi:NADPH:quinone reductase-like Zn-dependent oxidoreductase